ncbi:transport and Golgi organization protein 2 [Nonomuraea fuscirosea]|uniref:Transport and Golgi organization protein 2 n=1 Tax=Nonomuraea fuscirosea TaxID=1291556 RepID=A0A2T0MEI9_9ACTN|nr:NRDE family protein [Nonomuraea fuscirosea]PRX55960.1 transport and Golgi organization protein 2 [Nonomuraea fuscirosea]
MCTLIVKTGPRLTLMGVRDEFADRPWEGPGEHWPDYPGVIGGRDLKAGGTWLAVHPAARRAAALLNGHGKAAEETTKVSRGDLALKAAYTGELPEGDLTRYDPFHLVLADLTRVRLLSWDGERPVRSDLPAGTSMVVNSGLDDESERVRAYLPRFRDSDDWRALIEEEPSADRGALIIRHELPDGRLFASLSVMEVAIEPGEVTYEFTDLTADRDG